MIPSKINTLFSKLSNTITKPQTELLYRNPFELLVSVILSALATDVSVNKVTPKLFAKFPTPEKMHEAGAEKIFSHIRSIGLAPTKSKNIASTCGQLVRYHQGRVPKRREELEQLPGVGRKTANVVLNTAFDEPVIAVDTHVFRISNRTGIANGDTVLQVEKKLMSVVPSKWKNDAHHLLILQGRYVCKSRNPDCTNCVIVRECEYLDKSIL